MGAHWLTQVHINQAPVCAATGIAVSIPESAGPGSVIADLSVPGVLATDRDLDALAYSLSFGNEEQVGALKGSTGVS